MEVFREVAVEASTFKDRERSYFSRQHDDAAERRPDAVVAGSVYYYAPGKYTNNRFIVWRVTGAKLELTEGSLECTIRGNSVVLHLDSPPVPNVIFQEAASSAGMQLHIIVVTESKRVFRYSFPHPSVMVSWPSAGITGTSLSSLQGEVVVDSIFNVPIPKPEISEPGILLKRVPQKARIELVVPIIHYDNDGSNAPTESRYFAVGCSDGTVVIVDMFTCSPFAETVSEIDLKTRRWMTLNPLASLFGKSTTNKVEGIASLVFRQHTFIFVLTEDSMIRVFDMPSKACVLEYHIDAEQWDTSAPAENKTSVTKRRLKLLPLEKDDTDENGDPVQRFKLFVYVGSDAGESTFITFSGEVDSSLRIHLKISGMIYHPNDQLVDFDVSVDGIWALWKPAALGPEARSLQYCPATGREVGSCELNTWVDCVLEAVDNSECARLAYSKNVSSAIIPPSASACTVTRDALVNFDVNVSDYDELFAEYVFEPGRFSTKVLREALEAFTASQKSRDVDKKDDRSAIKEAIITAVRAKAYHDSVTIARDDTINPTQHTKFAAWTLFLELCIVAWNREQQPIAVSARSVTTSDGKIATGSIFIVKRGSFSILRPCDSIEALYYLSQLLPDSSSTAQPISQRWAHCRSLIQLRNQKHRAKHPTLETDVANLLGAMNFVASQIIAAGIPFGAAGGSKNGVASRAQNGLMFEDLLFTSASVLDPFTIAVDQVKQFLVVNNVNSEPVQKQARRRFLQTFLRKLDTVQNLIASIRFLLDLIDDSHQYSGVPAGDTSGIERMLGSCWLSGEVFDRFVSTSVRQIILSRFYILRNLLFLLATLPWVLRPPSTQNPGEVVVNSRHRLSMRDMNVLSKEIVPQVSARLMDYFALYWVSGRPVVRDPLETAEADIAAMANLSLDNGSTPAVSSRVALHIDRGPPDGFSRHLGSRVPAYRQRYMEDSILSMYYSFVLGSLPVVVTHLCGQLLKQQPTPSTFLHIISTTVACMLDPHIFVSPASNWIGSSHSVLSSGVASTTRLSLQFCLWQKKQIDTLQEYLRLQRKASLGQVEFSNLSHPNSEQNITFPIFHAFLLAECFLFTGQYDKALSYYVSTGQMLEQLQSQYALTSPVQQQLHDIVHVIALHLDDKRTSSDDSVKQWAGLQTYASRRYWHAIIQHLEDQQLPDIAAQVATVALTSANSQDESSMSVEGTDSSAATANWLSYLWASIFRFSLQLGDYQQAYLATINNPISERAEKCLRRLVVVMAELGALRELVALPYVGLMDHVYEELLKKARDTDLSEFIDGPNYYEILYSLLVAKSNYLQAAVVMHEYAERLATESLAVHHPPPHQRGGYTAHQSGRVLTLEKRAQALLATINALRMVDSQHAWLVTKRVKYGHPTSPKRKLGEDTPMIIPNATTTEVEISQIADLERQYIFVSCNLRLARRAKSSHLISNTKSVTATLDLLLANEMFEDAFTLARAFKLDMESIFRVYTLYCLRVDTRNRRQQQVWQTLQRYLKMYDSAETNYKYHVAVASTILQTDSRISLPLWLVASFKGESFSSEPNEGPRVDNSATLLRLYLTYNMLDEAASVAISIFTKQMAKASSLFVEGEGSQDSLIEKPTDYYVPFPLIDQLLQRMADIAENKNDKSQYAQRIGQQLATLRKAVFDYLDVVVPSALLREIVLVASSSATKSAATEEGSFLTSLVPLFDKAVQLIKSDTDKHLSERLSERLRIRMAEIVRKLPTSFATPRIAHLLQSLDDISRS